MLGKFVGILMVGVPCSPSWEHFEGTLLLKCYLDKMDPMTTPEWVTGTLSHLGMPDVTNDFVRGTGMWTNHSLDTLPGLLLGFCQAMC